MNNYTMKWIERMTSLRTGLLAMALYAMGLAGATFLEKYHGTAAAKAMIYYSPLFFLLQGGIVLNFLAIFWKRRKSYRRRWGFLLTHFAFIVILVGAFVSHVAGEEGLLHLREGERSNQLVVQTQQGRVRHTLPFEVELVRFTLTRYPGSASPSSYESELLVHLDGQTFPARVYMNHVLDVKGYRFFQASYDPDEQGSILSRQSRRGGAQHHLHGLCAAPGRIAGGSVWPEQPFPSVGASMESVASNRRVAPAGAVGRGAFSPSCRERADTLGAVDRDGVPKSGRS